MTEFLINWFWYLVAFLVGALVAWLVAGAMYPKSEDDAFADVDKAAHKGVTR